MAATAGLVALLLAAVPGPRDAGAEDTGASRSTGAAGPAAASPPSHRQPEGNTAKAPLPSHAGTAIDGAVRLDSTGRVIADRHLRRLFDYFLTGIGRAGPGELRARLAAALRRRELPGSAVRRVLEIFDRYIEYQRALAELKRPSGGIGDLQAAFEARYRLRRRVLGKKVADGFFAREEAETRYAIERRRILANDELSPRERERRLALARQRLPEDVRRARERSRIVVDLDERIRRLRERGASTSEIRAARLEMVGPEAARRLEALDRRRAEWRRRIRDYREAPAGSRRARVSAKRTGNVPSSVSSRNASPSGRRGGCAPWIGPGRAANSPGRSRHLTGVRSCRRGGC